jgi:alpha-D-ribose 1-methylphosphonate 5-triphosphate synthase subunit PhnL
VTPFLTVAALEVVAKEVVARNRPNVAASTDALTLLEALTISIPTFTLCFRYQ